MCCHIVNNWIYCTMGIVHYKFKSLFCIRIIRINCILATRLMIHFCLHICSHCPSIQWHISNLWMYLLEQTELPTSSPRKWVLRPAPIVVSILIIFFYFIFIDHQLLFYGSCRFVNNSNEDLELRCADKWILLISLIMKWSYFVSLCARDWVFKLALIIELYINIWYIYIG